MFGHLWEDCFFHRLDRICFKLLYNLENVDFIVVAKDMCVFLDNFKNEALIEGVT